MNFEYLYNNLKNGDALAFYHTKWYMIFSKLISFFSGFKMDHIACVMHVSRTRDYFDLNRVYFSLYEATTIKGVHVTQYWVDREGSTNLPLKNRILYYIPLKDTIDKETANKMHDSLIAILGRPFDWFHCMLAPFNKIITCFNKSYKNKILPRAFCALYVATADRDADIIPSNEYWRDPYMTPYQVTQYSCYKGIYEIV